jgi:hypothetical protein
MNGQCLPLLKLIRMAKDGCDQVQDMEHDGRLKDNGGVSGARVR